MIIPKEDERRRLSMRMMKRRFLSSCLFLLFIVSDSVAAGHGAVVA